ncbi:hypothetical protein B0H63DRAFT_427735 [Podospora didyma]|uniref:Uncharacterized protein n=1 Tax=Podospora didyma TaxID=330526 RepID=A0AAE0NXE9_9PEZI|nr:hypothetical protein B0H63DRAFT_427735 [Podospora didyma]
MDFETGEDLLALKDSLQAHDPAETDNRFSDLCADEYARDNGLTIDINDLNPWPEVLDSHGFIASTLVQVEPGELIEAPALEECLFRPIIPAPEEFEDGPQSTPFLQKTTKQDAASLMTELCHAQYAPVKELKLESPLLMTDHGTDCRRLARRVKASQQPPLPNHRLPLHPTNFEKGEGLQFPSSAKKGYARVMGCHRNDKLDMNRETMAFVVKSLKVDWTEDDRQSFVKEHSTYTGVGAREILTPPLSPLIQPLPEPEYFVPDQEACELPEPSDPDSRLDAETEAAEKVLLEGDNTFWKLVGSQEISSPDRYEDIDVSGMIKAGELSSSSTLTSPQSLVPREEKPDLPILPDDIDDDMPLALIRVVSPEDLAGVRALVSDSDTRSGGADAADGLFKEFPHEKGALIMMSAEQEKLQPLDAILRVPVPVMDFSLPIAEWEGEYPLTAGAIFGWIQNSHSNVDWKGSKWPANRTMEQRMVWAPIAHMNEKSLVSEEIEADPSVLEHLLARVQSHEVKTSAECINKRPGLAILRVEDDDDEGDDDLAENSMMLPWITNKKNLSAKRLKSAHQRPSAARQAKPAYDPLMTVPGGIRAASGGTERKSGTKRPAGSLTEERSGAGKRSRNQKTAPPEVLEPYPFDVPASAENSKVLKSVVSDYTDFKLLMDNFINVTFSKKAKIAHSPHFPPPQEGIGQWGTPTSLLPPAPKPVPALAPEFTPPNILLKVIVSLSVSKMITIQIDKLLPGIQWIERNYDNGPHRGRFPGLQSPSDDDADIIISPATGLLMTTMIRLRQKAVPGKTGQPMFRHFVQNVAWRYERLIILVSEGNKYNETMSPLSSSDAMALADLQGFAAGLETDVQVLYVGGSTETLAKWVASVICKHAPESPSVNGLLVSAETCWEVFLRRAGMNAYAAQVTLGIFKVPDGEKAIGGSRLYGLPLLVTMVREKRIATFERLFGGRKMLDRVSKVLDEQWGPVSSAQMRHG